MQADFEPIFVKFDMIKIQNIVKELSILLLDFLEYLSF